MNQEYTNDIFYLTDKEFYLAKKVFNIEEETLNIIENYLNSNPKFSLKKNKILVFNEDNILKIIGIYQTFGINLGTLEIFNKEFLLDDERIKEVYYEKDLLDIQKKYQLNDSLNKVIKFNDKIILVNISSTINSDIAIWENIKTMKTYLRQNKIKNIINR